MNCLSFIKIMNTIFKCITNKRTKVSIGKRMNFGKLIHIIIYVCRSCNVIRAIKCIYCIYVLEPLERFLVGTREELYKFMYSLVKILLAFSQERLLRVQCIIVYEFVPDCRTAYKCVKPMHAYIWSFLIVLARSSEPSF